MSGSDIGEYKRLLALEGVMRIAVVYDGDNHPLRFFLSPETAKKWLKQLLVDCPEWAEKRCYVAGEELILNVEPEE